MNDMTIATLIIKLKNLNESLKYIPIKIQAPNGLLFTPRITFDQKPFEVGMSKNNVKQIVLTW